MKYIGVPRCPYCKKRVGIIRTWRLKREGEYKCPRCSGISNIYLSPLTYVFALVAIFASGALYFFHKFILDDIKPMTAVEVLIPFAVFFLISLFFVYLEKPMLKKVKKGPRNARASGMPAQPVVRKAPKKEEPPVRSFSDDDYIPRASTQTGPIYQGSDTADFHISGTAVHTAPASDRLQSVNTARTPVSAAHAGRPTGQTGKRPGPVPQQAPRRAESPVARPAAPVRAVTPVDVTSVGAQNAAGSHRVSSVDISGDYFSKYDDPEYIQRRMEELQRNKDG